MTGSRTRSWVICAVAATLFLAALMVLAAVARHSGSTLVVQALARNSESIGTSLRIQIERAITVGISLDEMVGIDTFFAAALARHKELTFVALVDERDQLIAFVSRDKLNQKQTQEVKNHLKMRAPALVQEDLFRVARTEISAEVATAAKAVILIGFPANHFDKQVNAVILDMAVAVLIALILVAEFLRFLARRSALYEFSRFRDFAKHMKNGDFGHRVHAHSIDPTGMLSNHLDSRLDAVRQKYQALRRKASQASSQWKGSTAPLLQQLSDVAHKYRLDNEPTATGDSSGIGRLRMVVFLVALSEEICRPFFALYASGLDGPIALSAELLAGIPLTTFLLTWALSQPFGAALLRRFGASTCLATAAALTGAGMVATGFSESWEGLVFLRALTGFGFGCVLIVTQALLLRIGRSTGRAKAMSGFVAAVVAAGICGPVIGGLLAVKFGTTFAFAVAGCCALVAIVFALGTKDVPAAATGPRAFSVRATFEAMRHARLLLLLVFSAIPGKLAATAVLMMLVPLATMELGESPAVAGRLLLLYFLGFFLLSGIAAKLSDQLNVRKPFITAGGTISALACISGYAFDSLWGLVIACSLLGLGQAWLASPQIVLVTQLIESRGSAADSELALGFYRLVERFGGAMGPLVAAFFISHSGLRGAMLGFGILLAVGCLVTLVTLWSYQEEMSSKLKNVKVAQPS